MYKKDIKILLFSLSIILISLLVACNTTTKNVLYDSNPTILGELSAE